MVLICINLFYFKEIFTFQENNPYSGTSLLNRFMKIKELAGLYTDYLLCQLSQASSTMCSEMLNNTIKHDSFSRMLQLGDYSSSYVWNKGKYLLNNWSYGFLF